MHRYLSFQAAYLFKDVGSDSLNITYPQVLRLFDALRAGGLPTWSFAQGLGQDLFASSLSDPFLLLLLPFGRGAAAFGFAYMEAIKFLAAAALFFLALREQKLSALACVAGGLLYAFCGFVVVGGGWSMFSTEAVYCALALWAFERALRRGAWGLLPPAFGMLTLLQPALLVPYAGFFAVYGAARWAEEGGEAPLGAVFLVRCVGAGALGALLSAFVSLSAVWQTLQSGRLGGSASLAGGLAALSPFALEGRDHYVTALLRLYSSDLLGAGSAFTGWKNYLEAPLFYCGLVTLLLAPQAFVGAGGRRRRLYGAVAGLAVLPTLLPFARRALWAFSGDYYRSYSLFVAVALLSLALRALSRLEERAELSPRLLAATLALLLAPLAAAPAMWGAALDPAVRAGCTFFLVLDAGLLWALREPRRRRAASAALLAALCAEAALFTTVSVSSGREALGAAELTARAGYNDGTVDAAAFLRSSDPSFFRIEKDYHSGPARHPSFNDAMAQGYYGTTSYAPFNQRSYVDFLAELGVGDPARREDSIWLRGLRGREDLMRLAGVKYLLSKGGSVPPRFAADPVGEFDGVRAYRDRGARPLGFALERCVPLEQFRMLPPWAKDALLLDAFTVDDCAGFPPPERIPVARAAPTELMLTRFTQNALAGTISLPRPALLFFSIPWDAGWSASADGQPAALRRVDAGFLGLPLLAGGHTVTLRYEPPLRAVGAALSLAAAALYLVLLRRRR